MEHIDFHVGLLKGYLLAVKADPQIIHALHVIISRGVTPVSEPIGKAVLETEGRDAEKPAEPEDIKATMRRHFWTREDDRVLREMYGRGERTADIAQHINRSAQAVSVRISNLGLSRKNHV